jgi:cellulose synthase/poly-beta-1,6-N-acetylglucosamine synthase-like glycosyltransferase
VIIPVYNGSRTLRACLDALRSQDLPSGEYEVVVVDNGSTDATPAIVQGYGPPVRLLRETAIRGSYAARNAGIEGSRAAILAFTDADCIPESTWLTRLLEPFGEPSVGCVGGEIVGTEPTTAAEAYAARRGILSQRGTLRNSYRPFFQTANVAYRREVFAQIGLFEPCLESGGDADLCWRMQEQTGWKMHFQETAIVQHHHRMDWRELWKQYQRYGRGNAALRTLYPGYRGGYSKSPVDTLRPLARLGLQATAYAGATLLAPIRGRASRERVETEFYSCITHGAFAYGRRQGPSRPVTRTLVSQAQGNL